MTKALPESCLNCGKPVSEEMEYCPNCGQKNRNTKLPLKTFISDFFEDYFTVDAKFFRSIGKLIFSPGSLTREFNSGKRKTYIAPFRLYIFISFVFFFILAIHNKYNGGYQNNSIIEFGDSEDEENDAISDSSDTAQLILPDDSVGTEVDEDEKSLEVNLDEDPETSEFEAFLEERARRANENPDLFIQSFFKATSITMFVMLPFFGLLLYLFHFRRFKFYVEHLVHSVHYHSFLFVIFLFALLASWIFNWNGFSWIFLIALIYLILSLRSSYQQSYLKAILKALALLLIYVLFIGFAMVLVLIGAILLT
jgi:hypothetical protein